MSWYRDAAGYRHYPTGLPDYQLDPPAETTDELGGCTEGDREGGFACCVCESIPDDRWAAALDDAADGAVDEAKVNEAQRGRS